MRPLALALLVAAVGSSCNAPRKDVSEGAPRSAPSRAVAGGSVADASARIEAVPAQTASAAVDAGADPPEARELREALVDQVAGLVKSPRVLDAMRKVPRHLFVPGAPLRRAYADSPLPIGHEQTISQPRVVGLMTEALELSGRERVLEIGTGSGYQAAVLSLLAREVYTIEIVAPLAETARARLDALGYRNVTVRAGDGYQGWPEKAPFERILLTAAPPTMPRALLDQLAVGGILVAPVGPTMHAQQLYRYRRTRSGITTEDLGAVHFVPMVPGSR
jgi:protein-L-isoaspartate(D-aspartate) O-methyltransferase